MSQQLSDNNGKVLSPQFKATNKKKCDSCSETININAEICPLCGVRQKRKLNKTALLVLTFLFGGFGGHKFYTGKIGQGILSLFFFWTCIPSLVAVVEFFVYALSSPEKLQARYSDCNSWGVVSAALISSVAFILVYGALIAIAVPNFIMYRNKALQVAVESELQKIIVAEKEYQSEHQGFTNSLELLNYLPGKHKIIINITSADKDCFIATGKHEKSDKITSVDCNGIYTKE